MTLDTVKVHCCLLELMSRQILEQITAGVLFNTRRFDSEIFISSDVKLLSTNEDLQIEMSCIE